MSERQEPLMDERRRSMPERPDGDEDPPPADDRPSEERRWRLPPIAWARLATSTGKLAILVAGVSVALGVTVFAVASFRAQYGSGQNVANAVAWTGLATRYGGPASCTRCHAPEAQAQDATTHRNVSCETCHGPLAVHASSETAARAPLLETPSDEVCGSCHATVAGRPATFPQIDRAEHYAGNRCLRCHDPHSIAAIRPPTVRHRLAKLPACTTCHAPDGLKEIPTGHEPVPDATCRACHLPEPRPSPSTDEEAP